MKLLNYDSRASENDIRVTLDGLIIGGGGGMISKNFKVYIWSRDCYMYINTHAIQQ